MSSGTQGPAFPNQLINIHPAGYAPPELPPGNPVFARQHGVYHGRAESIITKKMYYIYYFLIIIVLLIVIIHFYTSFLPLERYVIF
jgi:hypothetical protein